MHSIYIPFCVHVLYRTGPVRTCLCALCPMQEEIEMLDEEFTKEKAELKELEEKLGVRIHGGGLGLLCAPSLQGSSSVLYSIV